MKGEQATIIHINVTDFAAAVAIAKQPFLADTAFAIAKEGTSRRIIITPSRRAFEEGVRSGMPVATAIRLLPSLQLVPPDTVSYAKANAAIMKIALQYSPTIQEDSGGHVYLDVAGTSRLFGPSVDCAVRIRNEMHDQLSLEPAVAVSANKLVSKIGTRTIRPCGITQIRNGEEAAFLSRQDVSLLPGVGSSIGRLLSVAGIKEIGQIAALDDVQVVAFLGKRGLSLRDAARGLDFSTLDSHTLGQRRIFRRVDFAEPIGELDLLRAAIVSAFEDAGLSLRKDRLGCSIVKVSLSWSDGAFSEAFQRTKGQWVLDQELIVAGWSATTQAMNRRVRIVAFNLSLQGLSLAWKEPDLFVPEGPTKDERLQSAVDATRVRFGPAILTHAAAVFRV
ncbi:DNA polymerase [uncultured Sphaerochaeta sp.]|uniref:DNA polymerase Y family protein n=1 Tax=uncultured Sphaerochaeta sp. TaxID=886478 RepID=UPI002A0A5A4C|nr:DNA polymerase [uncultured Sphaerochaeta sp.]